MTLRTATVESCLLLCMHVAMYGMYVCVHWCCPVSHTLFGFLHSVFSLKCLLEFILDLLVEAIDCVCLFC